MDRVVTPVFGTSGSYNIKTESNVSVNTKSFFVEYRPEGTFTQTNFQANSATRFLIRKGPIDKIIALHMVITLYNSNTTDTLYLLPSYFLIDKLQLLSGEVVIDEIDGISMFVDELTVGSDTTNIQYKGATAGFDGVTFAPTIEIPPLATRQYIVHIPCFVDTNRPMISAWPEANYFNIRCYWQSGTQYYRGSATQGLVLKDATIRAYGYKCTQGDIDAEGNSLRNTGNLSYRYLRHKYNTITVNNWVGGQVNKQEINSVSGDVAYIHFLLRNPNANGLDLINFLPWISHQLENNTANNKLGINQVEDAYSRNILAPTQCPDTFVYQKMALYLESFSPNIRKLWETGVRLGGSNDFDGTQVLNVIPVTSQTYTLNVCALVYALYTIPASGMTVVTESRGIRQ